MAPPISTLSPSRATHHGPGEGQVLRRWLLLWMVVVAAAGPVAAVGEQGAHRLVGAAQMDARVQAEVQGAAARV